MSSFWRNFRKMNNSFFTHIFGSRYKNSSFNFNADKSLVTLFQLTLMAVGLQPRKRLRTMSKAKYEKNIDSKAQHYLNSLKVRWMQLHEIPGVFAYQLADTRPHRILPGDHGFYAEVCSKPIYIICIK